MKQGIIQDKRTGKWTIDTSFKINGKRQHCCIRGYETRSQAENDYIRATLEWKAKRGVYDDTIVLFRHLIEEYKNYRKIKMSRGTLLKDQSVFNAHLSPRFDNFPVEQVFKKDLMQEFYNILNVSSNTKYRIMIVMRDLCSFAYQRHYINETDYQDTLFVLVLPKNVKGNGQDKRVVSKKEKQAFLDTFEKGSRNYAMFAVFFALGCRISEFLGICKDCVDLDKSKITIKRQLLTDGRLTETLKTSTSYRGVPISKDIRNLITPLVEKNYTRLFPLSHTHFKRLLAEHEKLAGLPNYSSHEIGRHTRASELGSICRNMSEVSTCARILGHSPSMFLNTYCHQLKENEEFDLINREDIGRT